MSVKLENSQKTIRKLNSHIGTTIVSSASESESSGGDVPDVSHTVDQTDFEFGSGYTFTTNQ